MSLLQPVVRGLTKSVDALLQGLSYIEERTTRNPVRRECLWAYREWRKAKRWAKRELQKCHDDGQSCWEHGEAAETWYEWLHPDAPESDLRAFVARMYAEEGERKVLKELRTGAESPARAAELFSEYVTRHRESDRGYYWLGILLLQSDQNAQAESAFREALQLRVLHTDKHPAVQVLSVAQARLSLAESLKRTRQLTEAEIECRRVLESESVEPIVFCVLWASAYLKLGDVLYLRTNIKGARDAWKEAIRLNETGPIACDAQKRLNNTASKV